jgi:hypothetical protein
MFITTQRPPSSGNDDILYSDIRMEAFGAVVAYHFHEVTQILAWTESMDGYASLMSRNWRSGVISLLLSVVICRLPGFSILPGAMDDSVRRQTHDRVGRK